MRYFGRSELPGGAQGAVAGRFIARIGIVAEEANEAVLWIELLTESGIIEPKMTEALLKEARELAAILTASQGTAKRTP